MLTDMQIPIVPVSDGTTQRLIANIQENTVANQNYYTGDQFILNGVLYKVTKTGSPAIAQGATIDIANDCVVSDTVTKQIKDMPTVKTGNRVDSVMIDETTAGHLRIIMNTPASFTEKHVIQLTFYSSDGRMVVSYSDGTSHTFEPTV